MFEPVNDLEKSLVNAAIHPSQRPQFYRDLLEADVFVIHTGESSLRVQNGVLQSPAELKIPSIQRDGQSWLPIFSSLQRLREFIRSDATYIQIKARDFFKITRGAYVILNPGSDYGKEFTPQEIECMLDGSIFQPDQVYVARKETRVLIGQPAVYPHKLVEALSEYFATNRRVNRAYLAQFFNPETDEKPHLLIGIEGSGDWERLVGEAGMVASEVMGSGEFVDFIRLDGNSGIARYMKSTKPFYRRAFIRRLFG